MEKLTYRSFWSEGRGFRDTGASQSHTGMWGDASEAYPKPPEEGASHLACAWGPPAEGTQWGSLPLPVYPVPIRMPLMPHQPAPHTQGGGRRSLTRVGPAPAEVQAREGAAVAGVQGRGAGEVELVQGHGAVEYVLWRRGPVVTQECWGLRSPSFQEGSPSGCSPGSYSAERKGAHLGAEGGFPEFFFLFFFSPRKKEGGSIFRVGGNGGT